MVMRLAPGATARLLMVFYMRTVLASCVHYVVSLLHESIGVFDEHIVSIGVFDEYILCIDMFDEHTLCWVSLMSTLFVLMSLMSTFFTYI